MTAEIIEKDFGEYFNQKLKPFNEVKGILKSEKAYHSYLMKALCFVKDVIHPLEKKGMNYNDAILDVASGDGQMSLALALLGYKNITLFDFDKERLDCGVNMIQLFRPDVKPKVINDSAVNLNQTFDVLISYQTIEHLSDEGNYSIAKKKCQIEFLDKLNSQISKLCYFNAPNRTFPIDGHDTGKPLFHLLPINFKKYLINKNIVKCSWAGISRPVSVSFLNRYLSQFELSSNYYAFDNMINYLNNRPSFDYMGNPIYSINVTKLSWKKALLNRISLIFGKKMQNLLPVLSVIYVNKKFANKT